MSTATIDANHPQVKQVLKQLQEREIYPSMVEAQIAVALDNCDFRLLAILSLAYAYYLDT